MIIHLRLYLELTSTANQGLSPPRNTAGQAMAKPFWAYLTPQFRGAGSAKRTKKGLARTTTP